MKPPGDNQAHLSKAQAVSKEEQSREVINDKLKRKSAVADQNTPGENGNGKRKRESSESSIKSSGSRRKSKSKSSAYTFRTETKHGYAEHVYLSRDGTQLRANDCIYLVCEPPGEPYYLGRIMEFVKLNAHSTELDGVRVNWFYRPRDIQRQNADSRLLFATMHSDISPLHAIRSKCSILHKSKIDDLDSYRKQANCFYFERLFDKFMRRQYEVIPVHAVTNVPDQVKEVLMQRWKYVIVEPNRSKELSMDHRSCRSCSRWCSSKDSVRCAICESDFHMQCVSPPMLRKPSRGFAWTCAPCTRAEALRIQKLEAPDSPIDDEEDDASTTSEDRVLLKQEEAADVRKQLDTKTSAPHASSNGHNRSSHPELWPFRYLGVHCNVNDAVDQDDRIYPRAASRIGQRHQAAVQDWPGRPIEYFEKVKRPIKRTPKAMKGRRTEERAALESPTQNGHDMEHSSPALDSKIDHEVDRTPARIDPASLSIAERPLWLQEKPANYLSRGEGSTAECFYAPRDSVADSVIENYLASLQSTAKKLSVNRHSPEFLDIALKHLYEADFDPTLATKKMESTPRTAIAGPTFTEEELVRFEQSVKKNGSELAQVALDVGTKSVAECVRFYYMWKKTARGSQVWANSEARRPKTEHNAAAAKTHEQMAVMEQLGDSSDDSAYDEHKAVKAKRTFRCKFCETTTSTKWRRAPGSIDKKNPISALCQRCAVLWRHYAVAWEKPEEVYRKLHEGGYKGRKRKLEEELLKELPRNGARPDRPPQEVNEVARPAKKVKKLGEMKAARSPSPLAIVPCSVCQGTASLESRTCSSCGILVHSACYGIQEQSLNDTVDWLCDPCTNSQSPVASINYNCVLCNYRSPSSQFGALKKTADRNWAHISCAIWNPYITFGVTSRLEPIDGISAIPLAAWGATCQICKADNGMSLPCSVCQEHVHVECALQADYKLGFDLQPVKSSQSRRDGLSLVRIGAEGGLMLPIISCPKHNMDSQIHAADELTGDSAETTLALYARVYKASSREQDMESPRKPDGGGQRQSSKAISADILRLKYQEFEGQHLPNPNPLEHAQAAQEPTQVCSSCSVEASPCFYEQPTTNAEGRQTLCHRCHWQLARPSEEKVTASVDTADVTSVVTPAVTATT